MRSRVLLAATSMFLCTAVPVALAGSAGDSGDPEATASASVKKKVKKLNKRVKQLEAEQGGARRPAGAAGGDLAGNYPNPQIAAGAVGTNEVGADTLNGDDVDESTLFNDNSLTGDDVNEASLFFSNALTGADINESTLNSVASATTATNVNGLQARAFHYAENANTGAESFLSLGGLLIFASCDAGGDIQVGAGTGIGNSYIRASNGEGDDDFDVGDTLDVDDGGNSGLVTITYRRGGAAAGSTTFDSTSVSASVGFNESAGAPDCLASGTAMGRP